MLSFEQIKLNWQTVLDNVDKAAKKSGRNREDINIVAVSKIQANEAIINGIKAGIRVFGENYAQEMKEKNKAIPEVDGIKPEWHFIGHLQRNKVKYIAPFVELIHTVDSAKLAWEISKQAEKNGRTIRCLLQVNTSGEPSKSGCEPKELLQLVGDVLEIPHLKFEGLMTIGSFSEDKEIVRSEFIMLRNLLEQVKEKYPESGFVHLSMGMSHDYALAIEEGATFVRVGTSIFGARNYH